MFKINLFYSFTREQRRDLPLSNVLTDILSAIESKGSIAGAARELGISYRHLWGQIKEWEEKIGHPLVQGARGRDTQLTALAKKLLWAERQIVARNAMELLKVRTDIEQVFAQAMAPNAQILTLSGCPDESLLLLKDRTASHDLLLDITFNSSRQGLEDLVAGRSLIAGFNAPANAGAQSAAVAAFADLCDCSQITLFHYCARTQGLGIARGNPLKISSLIDVARKKARYINREKGTGTRVLLEDLITQSGLSASMISGYDNIEASHQAVAQAILQGTADVGLCIESIAKKAGIEFIPLVMETYYLAVLKKNLQIPGVSKLLSLLQDASWHRQCESLAGYSAVLAGTPINPSDTPWLNG